MDSGATFVKRVRAKITAVDIKQKQKAQIVTVYWLLTITASLALLYIEPAPKTTMANAAPNAAAWLKPRV